ncbi:MAG: ABC transporter permease [Flavobacteriales bacterium]|nr:ABC transporter permease [Flavobacteriales bacterium]
MTFLGPVLMAGFYGLVIYVSLNDNISKNDQKILVYDESGIVKDKLQNTDDLAFEYGTGWKEKNANTLKEVYTGWLFIPEGFDIYNPQKIVFESENNISIDAKERISDRIEMAIRNEKMKKLGVSQSSIDSVKTTVSITALTIDETGEAKTSSIEVNTIVGMAMSFVIYFFIFLYGVQVMKGVIEEKTNRIVEIVVSSVKPFQLMMGKVFGLALVGLTQIGMWIGLTAVLSVIITKFVVSGNIAEAIEMAKHAQTMPIEQMAQMDTSPFSGALSGFFNLNLPFIVLMFVSYFIGGYLMYSALFAAVGAAVDAETETQQFMMPITLPLVFSMAISFSMVVRDPNGPMSFWLSIVPLTSPVVMMVRAPFLNLSTQWWEVLLSLGLLVATFTFTIWLAGRIYRTGILMYGKKATYKELFKWLFYKG